MEVYGAVPLTTCRILLSPSVGEQTDDAMALKAQRANITNFLEAASAWRTDASTHPENVSFFYFAGHGVQLGRGDDTLLLDDFGSGVGPTLRSAVSVTNIFNGMGGFGGSDQMARTQMYFIDSSRTSPIGMLDLSSLNTTAVFDEYALRPDDHTAVVFYAAQPGQPAFSSVDDVT